MDKVFGALWMLKKEAYAELTIEAVGKGIKHIAKHVDLDDPEAVKGFIEWDKPFYERYDKLPRIPQEKQIDMLIAN